MELFFEVAQVPKEIGSTGIKEITGIMQTTHCFKTSIYKKKNLGLPITVMGNTFKNMFDFQL